MTDSSWRKRQTANLGDAETMGMALKKALLQSGECECACSYPAPICYPLYGNADRCLQYAMYKLDICSAGQSLLYVIHLSVYRRYGVKHRYAFMKQAPQMRHGVYSVECSIQKALLKLKGRVIPEDRVLLSMKGMFHFRHGGTISVGEAGPCLCSSVPPGAQTDPL
jgi:hypothetical protein